MAYKQYEVQIYRDGAPTPEIAFTGSKRECLVWRAGFMAALISAAGYFRIPATEPIMLKLMGTPRSFRIAVRKSADAAPPFSPR